MKYVDCTKEKAPGWIPRKIIKEKPYIIFTNLCSPFSDKDPISKMYPKTQWLMDNLSSKSGYYEIKQYEYIFQGISKNKKKVGVAFTSEEHALAFKLVFSD